MDNTLSFNDIIKNSAIQSSFLGDFNIFDIISVIVVTLIISLFMFYIYKKTYSGNVYSHKFNVSLVLMALITSEVIMTISSNLVLSLGMVGALSIVRFRTAVKEPLDIVFMFWAIAIGITTGARLFALSIISSLLFGLILVLLLNYKNTNNVYLLVIHYNNEASDLVTSEINKLYYSMKSKTVSHGLIELTIEVKLTGAGTEFIQDIAEIEGVTNVSLVNYNGEFAQ